MAADVFGQGLHGDIDAEREGVEQDAGGIGVVERDGNVAGVGGGDDGWNVLDLHGDGAGALAPDERGVFANERRDVRAKERLVGFDFDVEIAEQAVGECAVGAVGVVGQEGVAAGFAKTIDR